MFAIAFDLVVADTANNHPKGVSQAYADIGNTLAGFDFTRVREVSTSPAGMIWQTCSPRSWP
jgi:virulence-associated protein VapD